MKKRKRQLLLTWAMTMLMILNIFLPFSLACAVDISTTVLTNFMAAVKQDGNPIAEGGTLTSTKPIRVDISFGVPVEGDDPTPTAPVQKGDTVKFDLSNAFKVTSGSSIELKMGSLMVAHATIITDPDTKMVTANVIFDGDDSVFDGTSSNVFCQFGGNFEYYGGSAGDHTISILEKTYTVNVPEVPIIYNMTKTGTADLANQSIEWKVDIQTTQGGIPIDLVGYQFFDDLHNVGEYIPASFKVDGTDAFPDTSNNSIRYVFPNNSTSPKTITFKTKITDSTYYANSEQKVNNKAQLLTSESSVVAEGQCEVKFTPKWIEKTGVSSDVGSSGIYDPTNRTITWTITANHMGATLNNVVITDKLMNGLTFKSAKWQIWDGSEWGSDNGIIPNANGEYAIGNINSKILMTIVTNVPDDAYTTGVTTYSNSASIRWDDFLGLTTSSINVTIGYNAISKSGVADAANQKIKWTVNVDTKGQSIPDLKVYDLLVYGNNINLSTVTGIPSGIDATKLTPQYGQKYTGDFTGAFTVNVIPIMQGTKQVADLVEVTGLSTTDPNTFSFESQVVNPNIFAGNKTSTVWNTATLFSANAKLNASTKSVNYSNHMLSKEMLNRIAMSDPSGGVNNSTTNVSQGFDYKNKSAIFRLNVNADGIDLTNTTNSEGQILGTATLTDILPDGWEFVDIDFGSKYLIFEGIGQSNGTILAKDTTPDTVANLDASFSGRTASFAFTTLDKPYVILVKARPTSETTALYFSANQVLTKRNNITLKTENWNTGVSSYQDITITSKMLDKNTIQSKAGELCWTVDYKPYAIANSSEKLEDQLPNGIDLRMDSSGRLVISGNIMANEMDLNADGSYTVGSPVTLELGKNVSYNNGTRVLSFTIPDTAKAYRFSYLTDITGEPGIITNKVSLLGSSPEETSKPYVITASDGSASLQRNGWISIVKTNGTGFPLAGAEFTLYAMDGTTVIKKGLTGSDGTVKLKVIPDGEYILRETKTPTGYTLESVSHSLLVTTSGSKVTSSIDGKTGVNSNSIIVMNYSENTAGNLTISNTVVGDGADTAKLFDFTLMMNGANDTYTYFGHGMPNGTIASGDTISLTHGQSITIIGLPKDATYRVVETDYSADGYTSSGIGTTGGIVADATQTALFTNTRTVGNLTISKTVQGKASDTSKQFSFTLTLNGAADIHYAYTGNGLPNGIIKSGDKVSLAHGQSITITGLPAGSTYMVNEEDYSGDLYASNSIAATGSIVADATQTALLISIKTVGNLTISKTVAGNAGDNKKKFDFTFMLNGSGASGIYTFTGNGVTDGVIKSGDTLSLAHGQSITIEGLPDGTIYKVNEGDYTVDGYKMVSTGVTGSIVTDTTQTAAFTNTRNISYTSPSTGNLTISKTVAGEGADTTKKFDFKVIFSGAAGSYHYSGNGVPGGIIKSGDTISLAHGQSITITGLPIGASYQISEVKSSAQGYYEESAGSSGVITYGQDKIAVFTNTKLPASVGSLTIKLADTDENVDITKKIEFIVNFTDLTDAYPFTGTSTGTLRSGDSILLAYGESITITGLPDGVQYTVTEVGYTKDGNTYTSTGDTGQIFANTSQTALFMNNRNNTSSNTTSKPDKPVTPTNNLSVKSVSQKSLEIQGYYKIVDGNGMPKTGDNNAGSLAKIGLFCFSIVLVALAFTDFALRKKYSRKKN